MYFSQNAIVLVMLMFVISSVFYATINYKTKAIEDEMNIKKESLYEKNLVNTLNRNIDKIVEDAFVNASYTIMKERKFFDNSYDAIMYITTYIKNGINKSLECVDEKSSNISYNVTSVKIYPTGDPLLIHLYCEVDLQYKKKLNNGELIALKPITIDKDIKLSRIPDPYVYLNKFYYVWHNAVTVTLTGFNDNDYHIFYIELNKSNFHYDHMYNPQSHTELRVVGWNSTSSRWNIVLPYWVQTWRKGSDEISIIWVRASRNELFNGNQLKIFYNSTTPIDRQNPDATFILFDDFDYFNPNVWDSVGEFLINNSNITVIAGAGSSVYTKQTYGTGYELMFRANFTPVHAQVVGFFTPLSDTNGIGWEVYDWGSGAKLYTRVNNTDEGLSEVPNGDKYLNKFYIYDILRDKLDGDITFYILNDTLNPEYTKTYTAVDNRINYPISINALPPSGETSNTNVTVDWILLKDINNIEVLNIGSEESVDYYKEEKPKTFTGTIYYGNPAQYTLVYNGSYSIIGLYTNKTDSWGSVGYKPIIEEN
ncbi:Protein of unknown function DUF2341 [Methanocaldococcus sp. FS406-22]|uniref:DUF2341 domain-containing protein n=1 Tax=Methanocaldococcus sp. (strain FS406-22) TaxID=644281 RepID=UPI0001BF4BC5|nr:DUF2341 domain-containing protein [Methanocaldococcus sp. FS406-22]ADC69651.1 Protein of unknown function DUF2341 [Methanocaldococcus sp. FS406-22]